ncbi:MAG: exonuclease domain-containing protein, partial [bacterium]
MNSSWKVSVPGEISQYFAARLDIDERLGRLLANRGIDTLKKAEDFLSPRCEFNDIFVKFPDMSKAVSEILKTVEEKKTIAVIADSDVDGLCGLLIIKDAIDCRAGVRTFVCSGRNHGISSEDVSRIISSGAALLITVDVGITENAALSKITGAGIRVIVTDHHSPGGNLPDVTAILNPSCRKKREEMAGCFVAFYLGSALKLSREKGFNETMVACDVETTGLSPQFNEIIEIGAVKFRGFRIIDRFSSFLKPSCALPEMITRITGIRSSDLETAPPRKKVLDEFFGWIGDLPLIFHNAPFDISFIAAEIKKFTGAELKNTVLDTLLLSRSMFPSQSHKLEALKDFFRIKSASHRALPDAETTFHIYNILKYRESAEFHVFVEQNLPLVALGTISDSIPLTGKSRWAVKEGFHKIHRLDRFVFKMIFQKLGIGKDAGIRSVSRKLIPFLNAAKRMNESGKILELLESDSLKRAERMLEYIKTLNSDRRFTLRDCLAEADRKISSEKLKEGKIIILKMENLQDGFRGGVSSRLSRKFSKPVIVLSRDGAVWNGSARGAGVNMLALFEKMSDFIEYGGHPNACGLKVSSKNIGRFMEECPHHLESMPQASAKNELLVDFEWDGWLENNISKVYDILAPFGRGNDFITVLVSGARLIEDKENHKIHRVKLEKNGSIFNAISREYVGSGSHDVVLRVEKQKGKVVFFLD